MKKYLFVTVAASCLFAACTKEADHIIPSSEELFYINAVASETDPNLKSSVDDATAAFTWSTGDQIAVYAGKYVMSQPLESTYGGSANAQFAFTAGNNASRADFAVFPASLVFDGSSVRSSSASSHTASALTITLPASYTLAQVQDNEVSTPMIATNAPDGSLAFKQLGALLRVTLDNVPKQTRAITFDFNGKKVQGQFTLSSVEPGTTALATSATDDVDDIITVLTPDIAAFTSGLVINLPIPTGAYGSLTVTTWNAASGGQKINALTFTIRSNGADWEPVRKSSGKRSAILPVFSVSASKKVVFAPGNLQAVIATAPVDNSAPGTAESWKFAEKQYDCVGRGTTAADGGTNHANMAAGTTIDLFCFVGASATYNSYGIVLTNDNNGSFVGNVASELMKSDFGENVIDGYPANTWETQLSSEWGYVLNTRTASTLNGKANARYVRVMISGVPTFYNATATTSWKAAPFTDRYGIILFPDAYEHPSGVPLPAAANINVATVKWDGTGDPAIIEYSVSQWEKLEAAGCVFLPTAGIREYQSGTSKWAVGQLNAYAYYLSKNGNGAGTSNRFAGQAANIYSGAGGQNRCVGAAVRLQCQVN